MTTTEQLWPFCVSGGALVFSLSRRRPALRDTPTNFVSKGPWTHIMMVNDGVQLPYVVIELFRHTFRYCTLVREPAKPLYIEL